MSTKKKKAKPSCSQVCKQRLDRGICLMTVNADPETSFMLLDLIAFNDIKMWRGECYLPGELTLRPG